MPRVQKKHGTTDGFSRFETFIFRLPHVIPEGEPKNVTTAYPGYFPSPLPKKWDDGRPTAELLLENYGNRSKGTGTGPPFMVFSPVNYSTSCLIKL